MYGKRGGALKESLTKLLEDPVLDVRVIAAEALGHHGQAAKVAPVLVEVIKTGNEHEALAAITALENFGREGFLPMEEVIKMLPAKVPGDCTRVLEAMHKIK